jgi:hypothetical protein
MSRIRVGLFVGAAAVFLLLGGASLVAAEKCSATIDGLCIGAEGTVVESSNLNRWAMGFIAVAIGCAAGAIYQARRTLS